MQFIDTHTHFYSDAFKDDLTESVEKAIQLGVSKFFLPSISKKYYTQMVALEKSYPEHMFSLIGLHPCDVKMETYQEELAFVENKLRERTFVGIGEIGIDLYWDKSTLTIQQEAFKQQIQWAKLYQLPINIHCREAFEETLTILENEKDSSLFGIFHCFSGNQEHAQRAIDCGMKLGIGGVVTFKNAGLDKVLSHFSLEDIVLETDAPYLAPAPYRSKRNESAYIPIIAQKIAEIYSCSIEEVAEITTKNALEIYKTL